MNPSSLRSTTRSLVVLRLSLLALLRCSISQTTSMGKDKSYVALSHAQASLLFFPISLFFSATVLAVNTTTFPGCPVYNYKCGDVNITYPFWVTGNPNLPTSFCGRKELEVACSNNTPTFAANYTVKAIEPDTLTITLIDGDATAPSCPRIGHNVSIEQTIPSLEYANNVVNLTFYMNCTPDRDLGIPEENLLTCLDRAGGGGGKHYGFTDVVVSWKYPTLAGFCERVVMAPVMASVLRQRLAGSDMSRKFGEVLHEGFQLRWGLPDAEECRACEGSEGQCWYGRREGGAAAAAQFLCSCGDGTLHRRHCQDSDTASVSTTTRRGELLLSSFYGTFALQSKCVFFC